MSGPEPDIVEQARAVCEAAHAGQTRDDGAPYATHPHAVAELLRTHGITDPNTLAAAYLHDVLEDTDVPEADLLAQFGDVVVVIVRQLTNITPPGTWFAQKQAALLAEAREMEPPARLVKLADRLHNLSQMGAWPDWKQQRYLQASRELLEALEPWPSHELANAVQRAIEAAESRLQ